MSHTPGPWRVEHDGARKYRTYWIVGPDGLAVVDACACHGDIYGPVSTDADARLIAAAPDLLAALDNAHGILQTNLGDVDPHVRAACDLMWTAIAKAKGE